MAVTKTNNAEGGTNGVALLADGSNSGAGSGDAFQNVFIGTGCSAVFSSSTPISGSLSYLLTMVSGQFMQLEWTGFNTGGSGLTHIGVRMSWRTPATWSGTADILGIRGAGSPAKVATLKVTSVGKISTYDAGDTTALNTTTTSLSNDTEYDIALWVESGTTTANGKIKSAIYAKGSATPLETAYSTTAVNTGTALLTAVRAGKLVAGTLAGTMKLDNLKASDTYTDLPPVAVTLPTVSATLTQNIHFLDASASTAGVGGGLSYAVTKISGPTLTVSTQDGWNFIFTPDTTTAAVYRLTVTESGGGSATQDFTIPAVATSVAVGLYVETVVLQGDGVTWS